MARTGLAAKRRGERTGAAIDVGSNSIHLLVARIAAGGLQPLDDRSELLGLGDVVDQHGHVSADALAQTITTLRNYVTIARDAGAGQVTLLGTEPLRRATNGAQVAGEVARATGLPLHVASVEAEARLTFLGATGGELPAGPLIVVDIGGGSTEISLFAPGTPLRVVALAIGSARLTNTIVEHDPPTDVELDRLHAAAAAIGRGLPDFDGGGDVVPRAIFVGGTATNLARLGRLTRAGLAADRATLARLASVQITKKFAVRPRRARQLAAGAAIVEALLDHYRLDEADVSDASLRDGAILAAAGFGEAWPDRLAELFAPPAQPTDDPAAEAAAASH